MACFDLAKLSSIKYQKHAKKFFRRKQKLKTLKDEELDFHSKKLQDFDSEQADLVSERIIQKITKQFANHLRKSDVDTEESLQIIQQIFQLEIHQQ